MRFPIDLVYLDRQKRIKKLRSDVIPWRLSACFSADSVLELAAGSIDASRSKLGDTLDFTLALPGDDIDPAKEALLLMPQSDFCVLQAGNVPFSDDGLRRHHHGQSRKRRGYTWMSDRKIYANRTASDQPRVRPGTKRSSEPS